ncbi:MAG: hypothetical protein ACLR5G_02850 [Eubacteriales bacterium]
MAGCLFDFDKLNDVAKNVVCRMSAGEVYDNTLSWAKTYDPDFAKVLEREPETAKAALAIGRGGAKPRKDIGRWDEVKGYMGFMFDEYFELIDEIPEKFSKDDVRAALTKYTEVYDEKDDQTTWFDKIKAIAAELGYAPETKLWKKNPDEYKGHVGDISMFLRVAVTGKASSPDMYEVMRILGRGKVVSRIKAYIEKI